MMTIRDFLELACDDSIVVSLYNMEDNLLENESMRSIKAEIGDLLKDERYFDILECDIESWEYIFGEGIIEINYCSE